jgi:hypothetical protein
MSIAASVNGHALCLCGAQHIHVTYDNYGHILPGDEAEASALHDAYLAKAFA